jgi:Predicted hydrolase (HD superfamily)
MNTTITRSDALSLLTRYNKEPFHLLHAFTVEGVMKWFAQEMGYGDETDYWSLAGLLHDVDFECFPEEHCKKAPELLSEINAGENLTHSICSHGYGICCDVAPAHIMEKVLFATDELTGLIGAAVRMRPSKSVMDLEVSSLKKKFKDKKFAAGCSRDIIRQGADMLGWELDELFAKTIEAMKSCEESVQKEMKEYEA